MAAAGKATLRYVRENPEQAVPPADTPLLDEVSSVPNLEDGEAPLSLFSLSATMIETPSEERGAQDGQSDSGRRGDHLLA